ncbi:MULTISPECIES: DUF885 domain-containing protein [Sphingopyxis]|uniref:DUF885 domain-containing protein n=1 Tax=Sphingopyxis TaxID=165697 RepID=UPI000958232C|nr:MULTISPECIES: DUF885 domain-containing protein [Sphingopyxis]APW72025.1 hypothetical protein BWD40_03320 [Sphingopyxis granuli]AVA12774.1 DUF885 domain-containing protein [Sphingopyxis sp. MG]
MISGSIDRRHFIGSAALAGAALIAPPAFAIETGEDARLDAFFERIFQRSLDRSPTRQSALGIRRDQDKWDDISEARELEDYRLRERDHAELQGFDVAKLSPQARLSHRMFALQSERALRDFKWRHHDYVMTQMGGAHTRVPSTLTNSHPIATRADAEAYIKRLTGVEPLMAQAVARLRAQEARGIRPPRFVYGLVIEPCVNLLKGAPFEGEGDSPILADFKTKLAAADLSDADRADLLARGTAALTGGFAAGYGALVAHLRAAEAQADGVDGVWKLPDGEAYYGAQLESYTTLPRKAAEVHALGLREVAAIHDAMRAIMRRTGFDGDLQAFFAFMRTDPRFYHPDSDAGRAAYLAEANALLDEIRARQGELFGHLPKAPVEVRAIEAWREKSAPKAHYRNPPQDGSAPGIFYINLADMQAQPRYQLAATLYHEAIPGHHIETCIAHEMEGIPKFRRFASIAAFSEGWGLYSELLPKEMGLYADPYSDFGRLSLSLMRACRLVVDTGIHAMRWTREQAVAWLDANMPSSHYDNQREIDRYIVLPGQATAYYIGMQTIVALRARAREKLGNRFDLRRFHDVALGAGPLPLPLLEERIDNWIADGGAAA